MGITGSQPALMYARCRNAAGVGTLNRVPRAGAIRSNYFGSAVCLSVNGTTRHNNFDRETWKWTERARGGQPAQLTIDVFGFTPAVSHAVIFASGALTNQPFKGTIVRVSKTHRRLNEGRLIYRLTCLDWLYQLQGILVTKRYGSQSATTTILDLLSTYAPSGFTTTTYVQVGLDTIDEIQFTMVPLAAAFEQIVDRIGGYAYWDEEKRLNAFTTKTTGAVPETINTSNPHTQNLDYDSDIEGVRNSIQVEGLGASVRAPIAAGGTTIPVDDISPFNTSGSNLAKLEAQIVGYTGVASTGQPGSTTGYVSAPTATFTISSPAGAGSLDPSAAYGYALTYVTVAGETTPSATVFGVSGASGRAQVDSIPLPTDSVVTSINVYRTEGGGATLKKVGNVGIVLDFFTDTFSDASLTTAPPTSNTAGTSALPIAAGATSLPVDDCSLFLAGGGWAEAPGGQIFSYTGRSASSGPGSITGIPASGVGSLTAAVRAGTIKAIGHLTGVTGIVNALKVGESINILVITEDATSIAARGRREIPIQDRRLSLAGAGARGAAVLAILKDPRTTGSCRSSDPKMRARRPLTISMASDWGIDTTLTVQSVTIRPEKDRPQPMADVEFASRSMDDLFVTLREIKERALIR